VVLEIEPRALVGTVVPSGRRGRARNATRKDDDTLLESFDSGGDREAYFDFEHPEFPNREVKRVNVDLPMWMVTALDCEAARIGVNRQAVNKMWVSERLDDERTKRVATCSAAV
jgi:hypothetical protein